MRKTRKKRHIVGSLILMMLLFCEICISSVSVFGYSVSGNRLNTNYRLTGNGAEDIYAVASAQLNKKYPEFSGFTYRAWCADFVSACAVAANVSDVIPGSASVANLRSNIVRAGGTEHSKAQIQNGQYTPVRGDIIIFKSNGDSHVGIVDKTANGRIYYIDGNNTTYGNGNNACVHYSNRSFSYAGFTCVINPKYKGGSSNGNNNDCNCSASYAGDYTCTANGNLYIRSGHGSGYSILGKIPHGATVSVSKADGNWAHVSYNGIQGYASMSYLKKKEQAHNPEGAVDAVEGGSGTIYLRGWAFDRDALNQAVEIHVYVGGEAGSGKEIWGNGDGVANVERRDVNNAYAVGNNHGYDYTLNVPLTGDFDVYVYAINIGGGNNVLLGHKRVTISPVTHDPEGHMESINGGVGSIYLGGWVFDRDAADRAVELHVYVGGPAGSPDAKWVKTGILANARREDVDKAYGTGANHGIDVTLQVPLIGDYDVYVYAINTGGGENNPCIGSKRVTIDHEHNKPIISDVKVTADKTGYTVKCKVSDDSGIDRVQFPTWTKYNGQDDIIQGWGTAQSARGTYNKATGEVTYRVNRSSHNNESGQYFTHIYAYDIYGNAGVFATGYTFVDEYEVKYNANGGTGAPASQKKEAGKTLTIATGIPTRNGYEFRGWGTASGSQNVAYLPGRNYTADADQTLYAVWKAATAVTASQNVNVNIAGAGRMYRIVPQTTGTYQFESTGSLDTKATLYDAGGTVLASNDDGGNGRNFLLSYRLNQGETYYIEAKLYSNTATGIFEMKMNRKVTVDDMSGVAIGGRAKDALRINWNRNALASGYIIEQYSNGTWNRIARIGSGSTTTYRVENLKAATSYQFRIKGFAFEGNTAVYGNYQTVSGTTEEASLNLDNLTGVKIGGRADNALRLNWTKNADASGYIIEQYSNGTWNRIARIGSGNTTTYRVENLKAGMSYQFRIKTFGFRGTEAVYGKTVSVSGKTNPAVVSSLMIGGTAKDALRLNWNSVSGAEGYIIEKQEGTSWKRIARLEGGKTGTYRAEGLKAGTNYQFRIQAFGFDGNTAIYSEYKNVSGKTDAATPTVTIGNMTGVKIGGRADNALRLNWDKNTSASGYIIEQNQNGTWTRIARIGSGSTTTYRVENLKAGMSYQFRIRGFGFQGSTPVYGNFTYINGTTISSKVSGLSIGGTASDAIRLNWNKNANASGYIIERYQNGSWVRVARIADKNVQTYRAEGLESQKTYVFRICSFGFDGGTALYSEYQMITGNTK